MIVTTVECTRCKFPTNLKTYELKQFDIMYCKGCDRYSVIVDSCFAKPDQINTAGITRQVSFEAWIMDKFNMLGLVKVSKDSIGTVLDKKFGRLLIDKYNSDHPNDAVI